MIDSRLEILVILVVIIVAVITGALGGAWWANQTYCDETSVKANVIQGKSPTYSIKTVSVPCGR